jgi:hypothetical protein
MSGSAIVLINTSRARRTATPWPRILCPRIESCQSPARSSTAPRTFAASIRFRPVSKHIQKIGQRLIDCFRVGH